MATLYLDLEGGNDANDGTSFANRKKTLAGTSAIAQPGDTVRIMASTAPNSLGVNGTFAKGSPTITLASAVNTTIDNGESAWTASANVTCTTSTTRKQGATSASIAVAAGFTTGLAAYKALGSTVDFSGYQQISFWFQQTAGTLGGFDIKLCSDNAGATPVDTFSIPAAAILNGWNRVTINLGAAMGASIQSVAFYVTADNGAQTYLLDNIVACKAPGTGELSHKTLIGKANSLGAGGDDSETWYAIRAIEGTTVTLDLLNSSNAGSTTNGFYFGTSETVTAYSLFPSYLPANVLQTDVIWSSTGTDVSSMIISGGWNRTDMTTQTGTTWIALVCQPSSVVQVLINSNYLSFSDVHFVGFLSSVTFVGNNCVIGSCHVISAQAISLSGQLNTWEVTTSNTTSNTAIQGFLNTISLSMYTSSSGIGVSASALLASEITISDNSILCGITLAAGNKVFCNGTIYGSLGETSLIAAIGADEGDTDISLNKLKEMLAAFMAGKVSASSTGGVTTYTYKKRNGTTTSFTSLCSEADGTRATTGSLS